MRDHEGSRYTIRGISDSHRGETLGDNFPIGLRHIHWRQKYLVLCEGPFMRDFSKRQALLMEQYFEKTFLKTAMHVF